MASILKCLNVKKYIGKIYLVVLFFMGLCSSSMGQQAADTLNTAKTPATILKINSKIDSLYKKIGKSKKVQKYLQSFNNFKEKIGNNYKTFDSLASDTINTLAKINKIAQEINKLSSKKDSAKFSSDDIHSKKKDTINSGISQEIKTTAPIDINESLAVDYLKIGSLYLSTNKPAKAVPYFEKSLISSRQAGSLQVAQHALKGLYEAYSKKADPKKALFYYQLYTELKDSLLKFKSEQLIDELKTQNEIQILQIDKQKKEAELQHTHLYIQKQKQFIILIAITFLITLFLAITLYRQYRSKKKTNKMLLAKNNKISEQKKKLEQNLDYTNQLQEALKEDLDHYMQLALRKQMNPHFIFNSLNSIQSFIMQNDKLSANIYLSKFAGLMRKVLENSQHQLISLHKELEVLKLYVELEEQRFDKKFNCRWNISESIDLSAHLVPPLIFQPYVENAIWHGLLHKNGERILTITIKKNEDNHLMCSIEDNGVGRKAAADISRNTLKHESLGTKITQKRIQLINSLNKTGIGIHYHDLVDSESKPSGTLVEISLPSSEIPILED